MSTETQLEACRSKLQDIFYCVYEDWKVQARATKKAVINQAHINVLQGHISSIKNKLDELSDVYDTYRQVDRPGPDMCHKLDKAIIVTRHVVSNVKVQIQRAEELLEPEVCSVNTTPFEAEVCYVNTTAAVLPASQCLDTIHPIITSPAESEEPVQPSTQPKAEPDALKLHKSSLFVKECSHVKVGGPLAKSIPHVKKSVKIPATTKHPKKAACREKAKKRSTTAKKPIKGDPGIKRAQKKPTAANKCATKVKGRKENGRRKGKGRLASLSDEDAKTRRVKIKKEFHIAVWVGEGKLGRPPEVNI